MIDLATFSAAGLTFYAAHHASDYWVQTDHQAKHKGAAGAEGVRACLLHVSTYVLTQMTLVSVLAAASGMRWNFWGFVAAMLVSGVTHYLADRREHGIMFRLARALPGKVNFLRLGAPRGGHYDDNPSLGTGAWALDQAWHTFWGVWVAALLIAI